MSAKTIAARILDGAGIEYRVVPYELDDDEFSAEAVANVVGMQVEQVLKTLLAVGDQSGPLFAVVPGGTRLDLRRLAAATSNRRADLVPVSDVKRLCGYPRGSVTVMGARRPYPVVIDESAMLHDEIGVSGGAKGVELVLDPHEYIRATGASIADIAY